ncbi:hypothetical protein RR48_13104 [Papilio machaon]|uniref:Uncharacterized protein n=1 Tax=Papilio machaon TaxID=76193 RepID=A0A194QTN7_PAPMA|nr:hypothetical protein RR48_13104 [Papilio machaon]
MVQRLFLPTVTEEVLYFDRSTGSLKMIKDRHWLTTTTLERRRTSASYRVRHSTTQRQLCLPVWYMRQ